MELNLNYFGFKDFIRTSSELYQLDLIRGQGNGIHFYTFYCDTLGRHVFQFFIKPGVPRTMTVERRCEGGTIESIKRQKCLDNFALLVARIIHSKVG